MTDKLYIGTSGISFVFDDGLYRSDLDQDSPIQNKMERYASTFDTVCIKSTLYSTLNRSIYEKWIDQVKANHRFKFVVTAPKAVSKAKNKELVENTWIRFWEGMDGNGGCNLLLKANRLGCVLLEFSNTFSFNSKNLKWIERFIEISGPANLAFEFKNITWWLEEPLKILHSIFESSLIDGKSISVVLPCVENRIVNPGWAGAMFSTSFVKSQITTLGIPGDFIILKLYGSLGQNIGSYDEKGKLEFLTEIVEHNLKGKRKGAFCIFNNTEWTYCKPLPPILIDNYDAIWPTLKDLPYYAKKDLPPCLHDALRLGEIWKHRKMETDEEGFVKISFQDD